MSGERFKVIEGSESGHCCFDWTVIDMERPVKINAYEGFVTVCECFEEGEARLVASALNAFSVTVGLPEAQKTL